MIRSLEYSQNRRRFHGFPVWICSGEMATKYSVRPFPGMQHYGNMCRLRSLRPACDDGGQRVLPDERMKDLCPFFDKLWRSVHALILS